MQSHQITAQSKPSVCLFLVLFFSYVRNFSRGFVEESSLHVFGTGFKPFGFYLCRWLEIIYMTVLKLLLEFNLHKRVDSDEWKPFKEQ